MKNRAIVLVLLFTALWPIPAAAQIKKEIVDEAMQRNVLLLVEIRKNRVWPLRLFGKKHEQYAASGVILKDGYILSTHHLILDAIDIRIKIETKPLVVVKTDSARDLSLLHAEFDFGLPPVRFAKETPKGDPVIIVSNPLAVYNKITYGYLTGEISASFFEKKMREKIVLLISDALSVFGSSGGGLWNAADGAFIGIVIGSHEFGRYSVIVSAEEIKEFLRGTPLEGLK